MDKEDRKKLSLSKKYWDAYWYLHDRFDRKDLKEFDEWWSSRKIRRLRNV